MDLKLEISAGSGHQELKQTRLPLQSERAPGTPSQSASARITSLHQTYGPNAESTSSEYYSQINSHNNAVVLHFMSVSCCSAPNKYLSIMHSRECLKTGKAIQIQRPSKSEDANPAHGIGISYM